MELHRPRWPVPVAIDAGDVLTGRGHPIHVCPTDRLAVDGYDIGDPYVLYEHPAGGRRLVGDGGELGRVARIISAARWGKPARHGTARRTHFVRHTYGSQRDRFAIVRVPYFYYRKMKPKPLTEFEICA